MIGMVQKRLANLDVSFVGPGMSGSVEKREEDSSGFV